MNDRDGKFFNCSQEHEIDYVSSKYKQQEQVKEFIKAKCKDKTIHYWTQEKLAQYLTENGYELKATRSRAELLQDISEKLGSGAEAQAVLTAFIDSIFEALQTGETITLKGFGTLKIVDRSARKGRNPATGAPLDIPASKTVKFIPSTALKEALAEAK